jgi:hypothetical protein
MRAGFRDQMFAAAEADFNSDAPDRVGEQRAQIGGRGRAEVDGKSRQQRRQEIGLTRPQTMSFAPAEEGAALYRSGIGCRPLACHGKGRWPTSLISGHRSAQRIDEVGLLP